MKKIAALSLPLSLLFSAPFLSIAHAGIVKIELTGNLDWGTDYTNVFDYGANQSLVGKQATLTWLIDLGRLSAPTTQAAYFDEYACGGATCPTNKLFMSASVKLNGITETLDYQYPYTFDQLGLNFDWDGAAGPATDQVSLRVGHTRNAGDWYQLGDQWFKYATGLQSSIAILMKDSSGALLDGVGLAQLADLNYGVIGGSGDGGSAVFNIIETDQFSRQVRSASGVLQLNNKSISWWDPTPDNSGTGNTSGSQTGGGNSQPPANVPEPSALALLGLGLGLLRWSTRRKA